MTLDHFVSSYFVSNHFVRIILCRATPGQTRLVSCPRGRSGSPRHSLCPKESVRVTRAVPAALSPRVTDPTPARRQTPTSRSHTEPGSRRRGGCQPPEPGAVAVPLLRHRGRGHPHVSFLALDLTPQAYCQHRRAALALSRCVCGVDGFFDAVNPVTGSVGHRDWGRRQPPESRLL